MRTRPDTWVIRGTSYPCSDEVHDRLIAAARADLAARIEERVAALHGVVLTIDKDYHLIEGDFGRKTYRVPPTEVTVTMERSERGLLDRAAVLAIVREEVERG